VNGGEHTITVHYYDGVSSEPQIAVLRGVKVGNRFNEPNEPPYAAFYADRETLIVPLDRLVFARIEH